MSHLCEKYSSASSMQAIKSELSTLRNNLDMMSVRLYIKIKKLLYLSFETH